MKQTGIGEGFWEIWLLSILAFLILAFTQESNATSIKTESENKKQQTKSAWKFGGTASITTSSTINTEEETNLSGSYGLGLNLNFVPQKISLSARIGYAQQYSFELQNPEYERGETGDWEDPSLRVMKAWTGVGWVDRVSIGLIGKTAVSKLSKQREFIASLGPTVGYSKSWWKLNFAQSFGYSRSFYKFEERKNGVVNVPDKYSISNTLSFGIGKGWSLGAAFIYLYSVDYQGIGKAGTVTDGSVSKTFSSNLSATLGLTTVAGTLDTDGASYKVILFDPGLAQAYLNLAASF